MIRSGILHENFSLEAYLKELEILVNIDSGYGAPDGATQTGLRLAQPLVEQGWILERHRPMQEFGEVIVLKNREAEKYDLQMVGHTDTVFPAGEALQRPFTRDETRAYGVGVIDMKQGCLAMTTILKDMDQAVLDKLNIAVVFNPDEERGSLSSKAVIDEIACRTEYALIFETGSYCCIQRKGKIGLHAAFHGKAGHAGYAFENGGINAINEMAYWIMELGKHHNADTGTTVNTGLVQGGQGANIIPDYAEMKVDIRYESMSEMARIEETLDRLAAHAKEQHVVVEEKKRTKIPPMEPSEKTMVLCSMAEEVCREQGKTFQTKKRGGLSDGNHIAACGCATMDGLGPTGDCDHSKDEYLELSTIEPNIDFAYGLICKLAEHKQ